jgi:glycosyltransferase involved in cell wall biosynthesis
MKKIVIFSDAGPPQINGVVTTIETTADILIKKGYAVEIIHPDLFKLKIPLQPSTGIYMPLVPYGLTEEAVLAANHIHIATEGAIGLAARFACLKHGKKFTTSFHTKYPEYLYDHVGIPPEITAKYFRWFHKESSCVMVATPPMLDYCTNIGIKNLSIWSRGVDTDIFKPKENYEVEIDAPIKTIYVGRVSAEKNLEAYFSVDSRSIEKTVIGDGPQLDYYKSKYPDVKFLGKMDKYEIAQELPNHEVFVFPSLTDTFGLVILEALACGLPVVAYKNEVNDYIITEDVGMLIDSNAPFKDSDFLGAFLLRSEDCVARAKDFSWEKATEQFIRNLI